MFFNFSSELANSLFEVVLWAGGCYNGQSQLCCIADENLFLGHLNLSVAAVDLKGKTSAWQKNYSMRRKM